MRSSDGVQRGASIHTHYLARTTLFLAALAIAHGCSKSQTQPTPVPASCTFSVSTPTTSFGASGGTGSAAVTTASTCTWTASSQADWVKIASDSHTGNGSVSFTVAPTDQAAPRTASLTVAMQAVSISQAGGVDPPPSCDYALTAEPDDFDRDGGTGVLKINTAASCKWSVKSDAGWATIEGATEGQGPATLKVFVQPNEDELDRRMTFSAGNRSVSLTQPGQRDCQFQVTPVETALPRIPWSGEVAVTTGRGCRWTASSDSGWLHSSPSQGSGSARVSYSADFNPQTGYADRRTGVIALRWRTPTAGQNVRLYQWGACNAAYYPPPEGLPTGATFANGTLTLASAAYTHVHMQLLTDPFMGCAWTAQTSGDSWLALDFPRTSQIMGGDGDIYFTIPANPGTQSRRGTITIDLRQLTIVQNGR
jgi:Putative binding domain, N-terminal/Viral BACON domain